jgi:hypothetical protein
VPRKIGAAGLPARQNKKNISKPGQLIFIHVWKISMSIHVHPSLKPLFLGG